MPNAAKGAHYPKMMAHRTTDRRPERPTLRYCVLLAAFLLALSDCVVAAPSFAEDASIDMRLVAASEVAPQWPPDLVIAGVWSDTCLPSVQRSRLAGQDLDIYLQSERKVCGQVQTPFELRLNPARLAGRSQLALGVYRVRLFLAHDNGSNQLIAFRLLRSGGEDRRSRPENGFWWSVTTADDIPALPGNGLSIEQQGDTLAVTWLSYESGAPIWYFGSQSMPGRLARIELSRMVGGAEAFSGPNSAPGIEPGLALNIEFLSPAHANAWLVRGQPGSTRSIEIQDLNLVRLPFAAGNPGNDWQGQWALVVGDASEARIIELSTAESADAETFRIRDRLGSINLQCRLEELDGHPVASFCSLTDGASLVADFDQVGRDRLSGQNVDGTPVRLIRLPR